MSKYIVTIEFRSRVTEEVESDNEDSAEVSARLKIGAAGSAMSNSYMHNVRVLEIADSGKLVPVKDGPPR